MDIVDTFLIVGVANLAGSIVVCAYALVIC
jgi:hypothetical protein